MIGKVLFRSQRLPQLLIAITGAFAGALVLLLSVQFYTDLSRTLIKNEDLLGADYLVVQKNVSVLNTLSVAKQGFSEAEIRHIETQDFVEETGRFQSGLFKASASLSGMDNLPDMYTELFFESVPDRFIDIRPESWRWQAGSTEVPIILPSSYLDAYNFGFAPSQGLPPLSPSTFTKLHFNLHIRGAATVYRGQIAGFSDRLQTILVPQPFMEYANAKYGSREVSEPTRLILAVKDISDPAVAQFIEENGYRINTDQLRGSRIKTVLQIALTLFLLIGSVIVLLAVLGFIQYSQLIINRVNYELRVMLLMGYTHRHLAARYIRYFTVVVLAVLALAFAALWYAKQQFNTWIAEFSFEPETGLAWGTYLTGGVFLAVFLLVNGIAIRRQVKKLALSLQG